MRCEYCMRVCVYRYILKLHVVTLVYYLSQKSDLRHLITGYREWAFALFPGLHFNDLLDRVENMGKKQQVASELMTLREQEMRNHKPKEEDEADDAAPKQDQQHSGTQEQQQHQWNARDSAHKVQQHNPQEQQQQQAAQQQPPQPPQENETPQQRAERNKQAALARLQQKNAAKKQAVTTEEEAEIQRSQKLAEAEAAAKQDELESLGLA